jgi:hypothetical protein
MAAADLATEPLTAMTTWERWLAELPPRDAEERARYAEYNQCAEPELEAGL